MKNIFNLLAVIGLFLLSVGFIILYFPLRIFVSRDDMDSYFEFLKQELEKYTKDDN